MYDAAVGADRNVHAGLLEVLISCLCDLDDCCRLAAADALCLACYADGTTADADLYEVSTCICKEIETVLIDYIAGAYFYLVAVMFADPSNRSALPFREALRGVDADDISAGTLSA